MPVQIPLSIAGDAATFAARVAAFRQAKLDHHAKVGEPAPREHDLVEACVQRVPKDAAPDGYEILPYAIVDDRPSLRSRKDALIHQVGAQETALMEASLPPGKRRLAALQVHDVLQKPDAERSAADHKLLADNEARIAREAAIQRHAAENMAAIEDLTDATIGAWQAAPFPGAE